MHPTTRRLTEPLKSIVLGFQRPATGNEWAVDRVALSGTRIHWPARLGWWHAWSWVEPIYYGFRARVPVKVVDIPQRLRGTVVFELIHNRSIYRVGVNCADDPERVHANKGNSGIDLEFKMQYRNGGYGERKVVPGGYVGNSMLVDWYARAPKRVRDRQEFRWDVYGRFGTSFATEVRSKAVEMLKSQKHIQFFGGLRTVNFRTFLSEIARSRVCIDLPGNGPFCFRLVNYLAVGACVVSVPHATTMPVPLVDRKHIVYTRPDMSDMVELCERYANDEVARESIMRAGREYYLKNLYWRSLGDYYLRTMLEYFGE